MSYFRWYSRGCVALFWAFTSLGFLHGQQQVFADAPPFANFFKTTDAQTPWEFQEKREGVNLFTRPVPGEQLREYKFLTLLQVPFDTVTKVMNDLATFDQWLSPTVKDWRVNHWINDSTAIVYFRADMPNPIKDQDVVLLTRIMRPGTGLFQVVFSSVDDVLPPVEGINRVERCNLSWNFRILSNGFVGLSYLGSITPGGKFPPEFATNILLKVPFENVDGLRDFLELSTLRDKAEAEVPITGG